MIDFAFYAGLIVISVSTISIICSLLTVFILHTLQTWNGYVLLVYAVAVSQFFYDASFYFLIPRNNNDMFCIYRAWNSTSGIAVILWINVMSSLVLYTTCYLVSFRVKDYFLIMTTAIGALSLAIGVPDFITCLVFPSSNVTNWIYFGIRLGSILYNILTYLFISGLIHLPYSVSFCNWTLSDFGLRRKTNDLLIVLISRLKYYPIVQVITRIVALMWDAKFRFSEYPWSHDGNVNVLILQLFYDITNPFAGIGYFLVFLWVQPSAYQCFALLCRHAQYYLCLGCIQQPPPLSSITNRILEQQRYLSKKYMSNRFSQSYIKEEVISHIPSRSLSNTASPLHHSVNQSTSPVVSNEQHFSVEEPVQKLTANSADSFPVKDFYLYSFDMDENILFAELRNQIHSTEPVVSQELHETNYSRNSDAPLPIIGSLSTISRDGRSSIGTDRGSTSFSSVQNGNSMFFAHGRPSIATAIQSFDNRNPGDSKVDNDIL